MTTVLIQQNGQKTVVDDELDEEGLLREHGSEGQIVTLNIKDDDHTFSMWMGIEPSQPTNTTARHAIVNLCALHLMCFGPVLLTGLDDDTAREVVGE